MADTKISSLSDGSPIQDNDVVAIARSGASYKAELADMLWPPLQHTTVTIPNASVLTLFTSPYLLMAASSGNLILPRKAHFYKPAGTAYTIGTATNMRLAWGSTGVLTAMEGIPTATLSAFFASASDKSALSLGPGVSGGTIFYNSFATLQDASFFELGLYLQIQTANITGGTPDLKVNLFYEKWPLTLPFSS